MGGMIAMMLFLARDFLRVKRAKDTPGLVEEFGGDAKKAATALVNYEAATSHEEDRVEVQTGVERVDRIVNSEIYDKLAEDEQAKADAAKTAAQAAETLPLVQPGDYTVTLPETTAATQPSLLWPALIVGGYLLYTKVK